MRSRERNAEINTPLPMMVRSPPGSVFNAATASGTSPRSSTEFGHGNGSVSVVEATYFVALLSAGVNGLSGTVFQYDRSCSYVRRPNNKPAPPRAMRSPSTRLMTSSLPGTAHPPQVKPSRASSSARPGDCITPSSVTWFKTTMRTKAQATPSKPRGPGRPLGRQ